MITLRESFRVCRAAEEAFVYISDFRNTLEWDATAQRASKLTPGPITVGTRFLINCALPVGSVDIEYRITRLDAPRLIQLEGRSRWFDISDHIALSPTDDGVAVDYRAEFRFRGRLAGFAQRFQPGLERMGKASVGGLKEALTDHNPPPRVHPQPRSPWLRVSDFSRFGYRRARPTWHPQSARLEGRHIVITGATSGLGEAAAMTLAQRGAALTLVGRDADKTERVRRAITAETGNRQLSVAQADLSLMSNVDALTWQLQQRGRPIDALINNAGALFSDFRQTSEGYERSLALLLLAPYRLTLGLRGLLSAAGSSRVINVLSGGLYTQRLSLQTLTQTGPQDYSGTVAYAQAKRALLSVTAAWAQQWHGEGIAVNAMHPGWVDTPGLAQSLPLFRLSMQWSLRTPQQGADTMVWLAAATETASSSGGFFLDRQAQPLHLRAATRESPQAHSDVMDYLQQFDPVNSPPTVPRSPQA